ncbi:uncharacterized protein J4E79_000856 [Alternaria viburni]|uniref:uncharacterized protein n=1 Tax=Alternaria viburni TaxID=566460 RepID=UPI0020C36580|nr:uncharacterized protein J4E79_000856 [Alternaria viburni]KAI4670571.1 hypothetical protein J4E79_000856 [Alternaria viburni]
MSIPAMEGFLLITYPATLPKEGKIPVEEKIRGLTNHESILDYVDLGENGREEDGLEVRGWKIQHISDITKEQAIVKYDIKDGEFVEIEEGYEWKCYEKGRWATPGQPNRKI